ncbi:MAG: hypothetical protein CL609_10895 [Anaerolineaceae bacterium]|nr:hypothetical protein [Anaerolineaceae bacterium]
MEGINLSDQLLREVEKQCERLNISVGLFISLAVAEKLGPILGEESKKYELDGLNLPWYLAIGTPGIQSFRIMRDYILFIQFTDSRHFHYDMKPLILFNCKFRYLHDLEKFKQAKISPFRNGIEWDDRFWSLHSTYLYQHYLLFETFRGFDKSVDMNS